MMKIYKLQDENGNDYAFKIEKWYVTIRQLAKLLSGLEQVADIRVRRPFSFISDVHIEFQYQGVAFEVWEPYGESDRYWITPEGGRNACRVDIRPLQSAFENLEPSLIKSLCLCGVILIVLLIALSNLIAGT